MHNKQWKRWTRESKRRCQQCGQWYSDKEGYRGRCYDCSLDFDVRYQDRSYKPEYNNGFELLNTLGNTGWFYRDRDGGRVRRLYTRGDNK